MLNVFLTIDVELWTSYWQKGDTPFIDSYDFYILGKTSGGDFGLPYQLRLLKEHDLVGSFFVETLFTNEFGMEPLYDIVSLIEGSGSEIQLHVHPEWNFLSRRPIVDTDCKSVYLKDYSFKEQCFFIKHAKEKLLQAGVTNINAARIASYGADGDTLQALAVNGISFDTSYNYTYECSGDKQFNSKPSCYPYKTDFDLYEFPVSIFEDRPNHFRHAQVCAITSREMENLLWKALEYGWSNVVIVSHSFEHMNRKSIHGNFRNDKTVTNRFEQLCKFLYRNQDVFRTSGFNSLDGFSGYGRECQMVRSSLAVTIERYFEQLLRRF